MAEINVEEQSNGSFIVGVRVGATSTRHAVRVPDGYAAKIGCAHIATPDLIRASIAFLCEREPATSILRRFSLDQIETYFPEYRAEIRRWCSSQ